MLRFRRFGTRLFVLLLTLLIALLALTFWIVNRANINNARQVINSELRTAVVVFQRLLQQRSYSLFQYARLLSYDYAFKPAFHSGDQGTLLSAMQNHLARVPEAEIMLLVDLDHKVMASTVSDFTSGQVFPVPGLITRAEQDSYGEAADIEMIGQKAFQLIVVPYLSPDINAWIVLGFAIDDGMAKDLKQLVNAEVSFVYQESTSKAHDDQLKAIKADSLQWRLLASTHELSQMSLLTRQLTHAEPLTEKIIELPTRQDSLLTLIQPLDIKQQMYAVLQRSMAQTLAPFLRIQTYLLWVFSGALLTAALMVLFITRRVTAPVRQLIDGVKKVQQGNLEPNIQVKQIDELGTLATAFNTMAKGLAEKEKVRSLLGKVVSKEIADELIQSGVALGGEEKRVTVLFSDIRNFTDFCEGESPKQILAKLNHYLTSMSEIIEQHQGVVDKYVGDAMMALFGTPVSYKNDAAHAIQAALAMVQQVKKFTDSAAAWSMGIGINTDTVVAGNMGSPNRLNYTVIGDGVNLASRLEGLTKYYGVSILVSHTTQQAAQQFVYQEVDKVMVKGKQRPVTIYQPLVEKAAATAQHRELQQLSQRFLSSYRQQYWTQAVKDLERLRPKVSAHYYQLFQQRIEQFSRAGVIENWDGVYRFDTK